MQAGTRERLQRRWFGSGRQQCSDGAVFRPLTLADLLAVLAITPLAAALCWLLLAAELLSRRLRRRLRSRPQLLPGAGQLGPPAEGYRQRARSAPNLNCCGRRGGGDGGYFFPGEGQGKGY